jgi:hypothetical protein
MREADNLIAIVSRLSRQFRILNISQPYRPPRTVKRAGLLSFYSYYYEGGRTGNLCILLGKVATGLLFPERTSDTRMIADISGL